MLGRMIPFPVASHDSHAMAVALPSHSRPNFAFL
jgi:hypothetical protein